MPKETKHNKALKKIIKRLIKEAKQPWNGEMFQFQQLGIISGLCIAFHALTERDCHKCIFRMLFRTYAGRTIHKSALEEYIPTGATNTSLYSYFLNTFCPQEIEKD